MLEPRVLEFFSEICPVEPGDTLLVALSGGPDSVALLHVLLEVRDSLGMGLQVAHLNHKMRGEESDEDARFVAELAAEAGLTLHRRNVDIPALYEEFGGSVEALARRERYNFLHEARAVAGARWIVTGHNADDQVETFLLNMMRGAGPRGLGGMLPVGPGPTCRPLIGTWREEIEGYLESADIEYRVDSSNADMSLTRNRIRRVLVPFLREEFGAGVQGVLYRESQLMSELDDYLSLEGEELLREVALGDPASTEASEIRLEIPELTSYERVLQRSVIRAAVEYLLGNLENVSQAHVDAILDLIEDENGSSELDLPRGMEAVREYDTLTLAVVREPEAGFAAPEPSKPLDLGQDGELRWGTIRLNWRVVPAGEVDPLEWATLPEQDCLDPEALEAPVYLRGVRPGDRLEPLGMTGTQKLSDLLINRKVPRRLRTRVALLCDNGGPEGGERILWVLGQRRGRHALVGPETANVVLLEAETIV